MLTQNEKKWLKARKLQKAKHLLYHRNEYFVWSGYHFAKDEIIDLQDALEFSERVAAKLATYAAMMVGSDIAAPCLECPCQKAGVCYHGTNKSCQWSFLTTARLAVEEEMDG